MAEHIEIKIANLAEIRAAFAAAPAIMTKNLNSAIRRSVFTIQRAEFGWYHELGIRVITGGLYHSIEAGTYFQNLYGEVGPNTQGRGVNYAGYVHDGTSRMAARPFLLNAVQSEDGQVQTEFINAVSDTWNEIARRT